MNATRSVAARRAYIAVFSLALLSPMAGALSQSDSTSGQGSATRAQGGQSQNGQMSSGASAKGASTASGSAGQSGTSKNSSVSKPAATFIIVPLVSPVQDQWMKNGCWAKLHDNPGFTGDTLTLSGPIDMPNMIGPFGIDWKGKVSSIETGAKATLTIFDNEDYRDQVSTFKPGERVADVSKRMGFFDEMSSLKVSCSGGKLASRGAGGG